jgi:hypothetical protein
MIRINLLKQPASRRKQARVFPVRALVLSLTAVLAVAGIGWGVHWWLQRAKPVEKPKAIVADTTFVPTSRTTRAIVEDVVRDAADSQLVLNETGLLSLPYADLSFEEKVNYEILYARNVFEMLGRTVPRDVGIETLALDSFSMVRAYGVGDSREIVARVLSGFRREKATILPKPLTTVSNASTGGFVFRVTMQTAFGLNLKDPLVDPSLASLPTRKGVTDEVKRLEAVLASNGVALARPLAMASGTKLEKYRRLRYAAEATCSYDNFVRAIGAIYDQRIPCAFEKLQMVAQSPGSVRVTATLVFTTKE